jgi:hypothetical protein
MPCAENDAALLSELERVGRVLGIAVRYEHLGEEEDTTPIRSGICRVKERNLLLIDSRLSPAERCRVIARALRAFDLSSIYITPAARLLLERA